MNRNKHYHLHYTKEEKEEEVKLYFIFIKTSNKGEIAYKNNKEEWMKIQWINNRKEDEWMNI